ncbi:MAG TPA: dihydrodipicolinate synthase family protein [Candidatus Kapabacteria bacterium]|nr:dihydrodipicolinate synthase family protein [Candidatus Kapabacteria bacterium]
MSDKDVFLPLVTPFNDAGRVCRDSVARLMRFARPNVDGFVPCLTSGEGWLLSDAQWHDMVQFCVQFADGLPVIAGIERATTEAVIERAHVALQLGAQGVICTAPFQPGLSQNAIYDHFVRVHDATPLDLYIYFESTLCNNQWNINTLLSLCALPRVKAIKESSGENKVAPHLRNIRRMGVKVYQGWEDKILEYDADGSMVSYCNLNPRLCQEVTRQRSYAANALMNEQCRNKGVFLPDWYRHLKRDLHARGIIHSPRTLEPAKDIPHDQPEASLPA